MIKQEQLLFKHNRRNLHLLILVHFSFSQSSHKRSCRGFINCVNGKLWQNFILHFQIHFLYYTRSNHLCSLWERYLEWWDGKFLLFWLSSFNPCHSCLLSNLRNPFVIIFIGLLSKPKSLIRTL